MEIGFLVFVIAYLLHPQQMEREVDDLLGKLFAIFWPIIKFILFIAAGGVGIAISMAVYDWHNRLGLACLASVGYLFFWTIKGWIQSRRLQKKLGKAQEQ